MKQNNLYLKRSTMVSKDEVRYWLGDDYHKWIVNVIYDLVNYNDPNDLLYLKKEIVKANQDSKEANE